MDANAGYREIEHTADWELLVWAPDMVTLLEQAARGMYAISGIQLQDEPRLSRSVNLSAADSEILLVSFLDELLWYGEVDCLGFDTFELELENLTLNADLEGAPIAFLSKEIKAVTYHNMQIITSSNGLEVRIVFDV